MQKRRTRIELWAINKNWPAAEEVDLCAFTDCKGVDGQRLMWATFSMPRPSIYLSVESSPGHDDYLEGLLAGIYSALMMGSRFIHLDMLAKVADIHRWRVDSGIDGDHISMVISSGISSDPSSFVHMDPKSKAEMK